MAHESLCAMGNTAIAKMISDEQIALQSDRLSSQIDLIVSSCNSFVLKLKEDFDLIQVSIDEFSSKIMLSYDMRSYDGCDRHVKGGYHRHMKGADICYSPSYAPDKIIFIDIITSISHISCRSITAICHGLYLPRTMHQSSI